MIAEHSQYQASVSKSHWSCLFHSSYSCNEQFLVLAFYRRFLRLWPPVYGIENICSYGGGTLKKFLAYWLEINQRKENYQGFYRNFALIEFMYNWAVIFLFQFFKTFATAFCLTLDVCNAGVSDFRWFLRN